MSLFAGYTEAHGLYAKELSSIDGGKKLKGKAYSIKSPVTVELWEQHISGKQALGIIPINENSKVKFAAIDIDEYPIQHAKIVADIERLKLPLVVCSTKSGGAHIYLFLREFTDAGPIVKRMREFAAVLGYGNSEIFPKQTKIVIERGDIGQWINVPYFDATGTTRAMIDRVGNRVDVSTFIEYSQRTSTSLQEILALKLPESQLLEGGPPCLNHLVSMGFPDGTRNNGMFNLGIYAMKVSPDDWPALLEDWNQKYFTPPIETTELLGIMKSLRKKAFTYMCKQPPIANFCNMAKCRQCKHGIGTSGTGLPKFGSLTKILTSPPIWFLEVEGGGRLELDTKELQQQDRFQSKCMSTLNIMPTMVKRAEWEELVQGLLENVTVVEMPPEASPEGQLLQHLEDFCTSRAAARTPDEILLGKPYTVNGEHHFRLRDFQDYLNRRKFVAVDVNYIAMYLREWKATKRFHNIRGKGASCYVIPEFKNIQTEEFPPPVNFNEEKPFE